MITYSPKGPNRNPMNYKYSELRLDSLISYLKDDKINLSPVFQRGHVWPIGTRRKLVRNIVQGKPIPAVFLYKELEKDRYSYYILDGKQRIESLILFIASQTKGAGMRMSIPAWASYFSMPKDRKHAYFWIDLPGEGKVKFDQLPEAVVANLGEYSLSTIEITLTGETSLDEVIDLFVDINQEGEPVKRFDVVKAIGTDNPLLQSVFDLIALEEHRKQDIRYKGKNNEFTYVLKALSQIAKVPDGNAKVDRVWERLLEVVFYVRARRHRQPTDILRSFLRTRSQSDSTPEKAITSAETKTIRRLFRFLKSAYRAGLVDTALAKDQTHFYTMFTSLLSDDLLDKYDDTVLQQKLIKMARLIAVPPPAKSPLSKPIAEYMERSLRQTTHPGRRDERQKLFTTIIGLL